MSTLYDRIGGSYQATRKPDPGIAARILDAAGDARSVLNVGAGTGSYEPTDPAVLAVEPSQTMIAQRRPGAAPVIQASAEEVPLPDKSYDAALAAPFVLAAGSTKQASSPTDAASLGQVDTPPAHVTLRDVALADLSVFFAHQLDEEATRMAAFPSRDEAAFREHWETRVLANDGAIKKTILSDGEVAGNILAFERDGKVLVGYWIGREFWGRGVATAALAQLLEHVKTRPLHAYVATHNIASIRVLEKWGFVAVATETGDDGVDEVLLELR